MDEQVSLDGRILAAADAAIPAVSSSALYGKGIFTTVAIYKSEPFLWDKHWNRLAGDAAKIGMDISEISEESVRQSLGELIYKNNTAEGRARITILDIASGDFWSSKFKQKPKLFIMTAGPRTISDNFRLTVSPYPINSRSPLAGVKSCNYLDNLLALEEAKNTGYDEAIRLNERGDVVSACMANVFWLKDGELFTPSLRAGCLEGTMREFVLAQIDCNEVEMSPEQLYLADAIFLTSAGLGIVQVTEFEGRTSLQVRHPITSILST
jgi:branched-subunit amino acid aminotransferase/4-amino-4-deoxychorismate lyase